MIIYLSLFVLGLSIGSFLNVLIYRLEESEDSVDDSEKSKILKSIAVSRSHCRQCKKQIDWHDNIPLLSFIILRGKCRNCGQKISWQYPFVELMTGILFVAVYGLSINGLRFTVDNAVYLISLLIIFSGLWAIFVYDFKHYIIPNKILYPLILVVVALNLFTLSATHYSFWNLAISFSVPLFFLSLIIVSRGDWMGMGDVKLALFMALFLSWPNILVATLASFWLGTIASLPLLLMGKKGLKSQIPFGPFLIVGTFIAFFWGDEITRWYLRLGYDFQVLDF